MAQLLGVFTDLTQAIGGGISTLVTNGSQEDKDDRFHKEQAAFVALEPKVPGKHIVIAYNGQPAPDTSQCVNVQEVPFSLQRLTEQNLDYTAYVFDYGTFVHHGDGGLENWLYDSNDPKADKDYDKQHHDSAKYNQ